MLEPREPILKMIQEGILIPVEYWDLYINGEKKSIMPNIGLKVYLQSFITEEYESHVIQMDHEWAAVGNLIARLLPWLNEKKIWIHKSDREVTIFNNPEFKKQKKKEDKIAKTGRYTGELKESII